MEPKYSKVYDALVQRIAEMSPGQRLESEVKLASSFNVSPMTVRRALMLLSQNGLTVGIPGRGTFVAEPASHASGESSVLTSSGDCLAPAGPLTHPKLVSAALQMADDAERQILRATEEALVARIQRAHYLDEAHTKLVGVEIGIVRADCFPGILGLDLSLSLTELLQSSHWKPRKRLEISRVIRASIAMPEEAKQLHLSEPGALLTLKTSFAEGRKICAEVTIKFLGEQIEINV